MEAVLQRVFKVTTLRMDTQSINQSINHFISLRSKEARATVRLCRIKEKCLETDLKCVNGWSSSTVQWKRVPKLRSSNRETTSSSVQVVQRNWQKLLCWWCQGTAINTEENKCEGVMLPWPTINVHMSRWSVQLCVNCIYFCCSWKNTIVVTHVNTDENTTFRYYYYHYCHWYFYSH